jgi:hypothetical protein
MGVCVAGFVGAGSQVVTCTDGEANVGMGSMNTYSFVPQWERGREKEKSEADFYTVLARSAKQRGVSVSVMRYFIYYIYLFLLSFTNSM